MKTIFFSIFFVGMTMVIASAQSQSCTPPPPIDQKAALGVWQGNYTSNGEIRPLRIVFKEVNNQLVSLLDLPEFGIKEQRFDIDICESNEFHLKNNVDKVTMEFVGMPQNNRITGRLTVNKLGQKVDEIFTVSKRGNTYLGLK